MIKGNMSNLLKQAQDVQKKIEEIQNQDKPENADLARLEIHAPPVGWFAQYSPRQRESPCLYNLGKPALNTASI